MASLLLGTTNPAKIVQLQGLLSACKVGLSVMPMAPSSFSVEETGTSALENARIKAEAYAKHFHMPVLSMDNALFLDGLRDAEQPGIYIRRRGGSALNDEELLLHFQSLIASKGDAVSGHWEFAFCIAGPDGEFEEQSVEVEAQFTSARGNYMIRGYPLDSLQFISSAGKYFSDMSESEQTAFWKQHMASALCGLIECYFNERL